MKRKVVLITDSFPYLPGEEFLETELKYWQSIKDVNLIIMPKMETGNCRILSKNIIIDTRLNYKKMNKAIYILKALLHPVFYKELKLMMFKKPIILKNVIRSIAYFLFFKDILESYILENKEEIFFYTYWHGEASYALQSLMKKIKHIKVISRTHGYDLYQERREENYMPLKRQFLTNLTKLYVISNAAKSYLIDTYGFDKNIIKLSRLGVSDLDICSSCSEESTLHIVSCSYIVGLKRIDKIIDALVLLAEKNIYKQIDWTHIGDGVLRKEIEDYAYKRFQYINNINYEFKGHMKNKDVYEFYRNNSIDVFINVSETEGVPVTIMEAMSCHIPVIAPNIGGISEILNTKYNGILLNKEAALREIVEALSMGTFFKSLEVRENAYMMYKQKYDAKINYTNFIESISSL